MKNLHQSVRAKLSATILAGIALTAFIAPSVMALTPSGTYTWWATPASGYTDMRWTIRPETNPAPQGWFWAQDWWLDNGSGGSANGYAGLQTVGSETGGKVAIFSIWDATGASTTNPNAHCLPFGGEGIGYSCRMVLDWKTNQDYAFTLRKVDGTSWEVLLKDVTANTQSSIGVIAVPATWGGIKDQTVNFTEYYSGALTTCNSINYARARFSTPTFASGTVTAAPNGPSIANNDCLTTSMVSSVPDGTYHEMGLKAGLRGSYYAGTNFTTLKNTRTDHTINFNWASGAPLTNLPVDNFSIRWTGKFQPTTSSLHTFCVKNDDGARLWINGVQLVNDWTKHGITEKCAGTTLTAGQFYDLKLEYVDYTADASIKLYYSTPSQPKKLLPDSMTRAL